MSNNTNREILIAGSVAAFTIDLLVYPLDTIKTRLQSQDYIKTYASPSSSALKKLKGAAAAASSASSSPWALRGLYQGVGSVIVATLPAAGIFFTVYESTKSALASVLPASIVPQAVIHSLASGTAELSSCLVLTPAEVIKQNAQMSRRQEQTGGAGSKGGSTSLQALRMLRDAEGGATRRLLTGYTALVARNLPFTALQFPVFEAMRARLWRWRDDDGSGKTGSRKGAGGVERGQGLLETGLINGVSAGTSGALAAALTTPTDVVKTRMMLSAGQREREAHAGKQVVRKDMSGFQVAKLIYQERGVRGLFRGGTLRAAWTAVGSGLYLGTYEVAKVWLKGGQDPEDDGI